MCCHAPRSRAGNGLPPCQDCCTPVISPLSLPPLQVQRMLWGFGGTGLLLQTPSGTWGSCQHQYPPLAQGARKEKELTLAKPPSRTGAEGALGGDWGASGVRRGKGQEMGAHHSRTLCHLCLHSAVGLLLGRCHKRRHQSGISSPLKSCKDDVRDHKIQARTSNQKDTLIF